mmetsp:Transcript_2122/g.4888  ORF Transcript_2122/g.4888 Transcript_2122/m.4888 type:complete len:234 (-) Transcript_2122:459-1160(-)
MMTSTRANSPCLAAILLTTSPEAAAQPCILTAGLVGTHTPMKVGMPVLTIRFPRVPTHVVVAGTVMVSATSPRRNVTSSNLMTLILDQPLEREKISRKTPLRVPLQSPTMTSGLINRRLLSPRLPGQLLLSRLLLNQPLPSPPSRPSGPQIAHLSIQHPFEQPQFHPTLRVGTSTLIRVIMPSMVLTTGPRSVPSLLMSTGTGRNMTSTSSLICPRTTAAQPTNLRSAPAQSI